MTTQTLPETITPASAGDDKPTLHTFCIACYPKPAVGNVALCGHRAKGDGPVFLDGQVPADWPEYVVCLDLIPNGCPKCGAGRCQNP